MTIKRIGQAPYVAFAIGNEAGAADYLAFCNATLQAMENDPSAQWAPAPPHPAAFDANGQRVVPFIGPGTAGLTEIVAGEEAARVAAGGVLGLGVDREVEDEE